MATLTNPTNTPAAGGGVISCETNTSRGIVYAAIRNDRAWTDSAADHAAIKAGVGGNVTWAGSMSAVQYPEFTVAGLTGDMHIGWVHDDQEPSELIHDFANGDQPFDKSSRLWSGNWNQLSLPNIYTNVCGQLKVRLNADWSAMGTTDCVFRMGGLHNSEQSSFLIQKTSTAGQVQMALRPDSSQTAWATFAGYTGVTNDILDVRWRKNSSGMDLWVNGTIAASSAGPGEVDFAKPLNYVMIGGRLHENTAYDAAVTPTYIRIVPWDLSTGVIEGWA